MSVYDEMKVLVLSPHTDDGELGCGGVVQRFKNVHYTSFTFAEDSIKGFPKDSTKKEMYRAVKELGIENVTTFNFPVRNFPMYRQDILEKIVLLNKRVEPDLVFCPSLSDLHQDHKTIAEEALRVFKRKKILGYCLPWNDGGFKINCFIKLTEKELTVKMNALQKYESQMWRGIDSEYIQSMARFYGCITGCQYAEAFEVIRWVQ